MKNNRFITLVFILLALVLLALAASRLSPLDSSRRELGLDYEEPLKGSEIAGELRIPTVAMFTFRSLILDYLWIRADNLKNDGQYFDALHLSRLICALQPNLASVWDFQAWNMAYNISVAMPTFPERWNWVRAGFELLRDEGLKYNPGNEKIYHSLVMIFQHKMGAISDDAHYYYKLRLATEMMPILGVGNGTNEELAALAGVDRSWDKYRSKNPDLAALADKLVEIEPKFDNDKDMLKGVAEQGLQGCVPEVLEILGNAADSAVRKLEFYVRSGQLRDTWKMDPNTMIEINNKFGPVDLRDGTTRGNIDWRLPYAHGLYWAYVGIKAVEAKKSYHPVRLERGFYHNLQNFFHYGQLNIYQSAPPVATEREEGQEILRRPDQVGLRAFVSQDLTMFPVAYQATKDLISSYEGTDERVPGGFQVGSMNLGRNGVVDLFLAGHEKMARNYYNDLRSREPENPEFQVPIEKFVQGYLREEIASITPKQASNFIKSGLRDSFWRYAVGDIQNSRIREEFARLVHKKFNEEFDDVEGDRTSLPDFAEMRWLAMMEFLGDDAVDPYVKGQFIARLEIEYPEIHKRVMEKIKQLRQQAAEKSPGPLAQ